MKKSHETIGALVHRLRNERGLTQQEFSRRLKTSQSAVARIERGEQNISVDLLQKISHALGRPILELSSGAMNFKITGGKQLHGM